eukprot:Protomagalhaensia_sp_Gyna_25__3484@NODE_3133_length_717_cov_5_073746_g2619_i0_p1_GENE_NODE_3133_length_717_cov_5_073746_g2619_i0NODE_3133_length_717_cov_5_073746_g2619_i0_p1_ORF_typecomplete_len131_score22_57_NODE_3133_length_717_cov_5_073746_g2619_i074466
MMKTPEQPTSSAKVQILQRPKKPRPLLPLNALDLTPPTQQTALKLALCRRGVVLTRDDLLAGRPLSSSKTTRLDTMSSDSTAASDFDTECPPDALFLLERCSVLSSEISTSGGAFLTLSGSDISLLKDYM